ncbi:SDR family oxidoreductase [Simplicispira suum]|uniref:Short-chain dehydrogenase n=1 Tax=Simplicispira suum TaxID=2109915 RepID=A0A2S0N2Y1_9BURK|nr:SDR family oxidoreductase [Simplicispira suum]AVO42397.1 short-chain dehydrogenase [Simplicispira suum]
MMIKVDYAGKHVFVAGGTSGINLALAEAFASSGASVSVVSRDGERVQRAVERLRALGAKAAGAAVDVRDPVTLTETVGGFSAQLGLIDVVVSGAAGNFLCPAERLSPNGFRTVVDIDLNGSFNVMHAAFEHLRKPGASLIHITAPQSSVPMRYQVHCAAAKAGVDQMTRVLALEWGPLGIRVNAISPGPIDETEGFARLIAPDEKTRSRAQGHVPLRRFGRTEDIANLALFLGSDHAGYVSGAVIPCDGGGALESVKPAIEAAGSKGNQ